MYFLTEVLYLLVYVMHKYVCGGLSGSYSWGLITLITKRPQYLVNI